MVNQFQFKGPRSTVVGRLRQLDQPFAICYLSRQHDRTAMLLHRRHEIQVQIEFQLVGHDDVMEAWPTLPLKDRPKHFNRTFGVITRMLAEMHNADSVAYAMHKTQMYFTEEQLKGEKSPPKERFRKVRDEFYKQSSTTQRRRIDRIVSTYPSLREALKMS